jgi:uncharacterized membrane protein YfcA
MQMRFSVKKINWDNVFSVSSWVLVVILIITAFSVFVSPALVNGPVAKLIGIYYAEWFYCFMYLSFAVLLTWAKVKKKKKMRKYVLAAIYLAGLFTGFLTLSLGGGWAAVDNLATATLAAGCWLYWTFKTEYIDHSYFQGLSKEFRDEIPPRH